MAKHVCYICKINGKQIEFYDPEEAREHISSHFPTRKSNFEEKEEKYKKVIEEITCSLKFFKKDLNERR